MIIIRYRYVIIRYWHVIDAVNTGIFYGYFLEFFDFLIFIILDYLTEFPAPIGGPFLDDDE